MVMVVVVFKVRHGCGHHTAVLSAIGRGGVVAFVVLCCEILRLISVDISFPLISFSSVFLLFVRASSISTVTIRVTVINK